ncbi:MAG: hypothetical protein CME70_14285 [Halobacteriovorax sp.]|nr:hypothetical protein [Halobacteriovorax sp.]|tara:strand:+ start:282064 stop:282699 length:636 start_codon:yes stop_codon:yes gene_type:complete
MKSIAIVIMTFCLAGSLFAQDRRLIKQQIRDLSLRIERDAPYSDATINDLREAKDMMRQSLALINNNGGGNTEIYKLCINYAFEKYKRQYSQSDALDRAQTNCRNVADIDILKFLFEKHYRGNTNGAAMDLATAQSDFRVKGRLDLIEFAYDKHYKGNTSSQAATKAVENMRIIRNTRGTLSCFQEYFPIHYRGNTSSVAMDKTAQTCSRL